MPSQNKLKLSSPTLREALSQRLPEADRALFVPLHTDKILSYPAAGGDYRLNFNGQVLNKQKNPIFCRDLAYYVLKQELKGYHHALGKKTRIAGIPELRDAEYDSSDFVLQGTRYDFFDSNKLGQLLIHLKNTLAEGASTRFLVGTKNHLMTMSVKRLDDISIIKCYDPNKTTTHMRIICQGDEALASIRLNHFISADDLKLYEADTHPLMATSYHISDKKEVFIDSSDKVSILYWLIQFRFNEKLHQFIENECNTNPNIVQLLTSKYNNKNFLHYFAIHENNLKQHHETMNTIIATVINNPTLTTAQKVAILTYPDARERSTLAICIGNHNKTMLNMLLTHVATSCELSLSEKIEILAAKYQGEPLLSWLADVSDASNVASIIHLYLGAVLDNKHLNIIEKRKLLLAQDSDGVTAIASAMAQGHQAFVDICHDAIDASTLSGAEKRLLHSDITRYTHPTLLPTLGFGSLFSQSASTTAPALATSIPLTSKA